MGVRVLPEHKDGRCPHRKTSPKAGGRSDGAAAFRYAAWCWLSLLTLTAPEGPVRILRNPGASQGERHEVRLIGSTPVLPYCLHDFLLHARGGCISTQRVSGFVGV